VPPFDVRILEGSPFRKLADEAHATVFLRIFRARSCLHYKLLTSDSTSSPDSGRGQFFFKKIKEKETHGDKRKKIFFRKRGQEKEKKRENETANFSLQSVARLAVTI
jgi:hypothetical protein